MPVMGSSGAALCLRVFIRLWIRSILRGQLSKERRFLTLAVSVRAKRSSGRISKNEGLSMKATELVERLCFQGVKQLSRSFRRKAVSSLRCIARELGRFCSVSAQATWHNGLAAVFERG